MPAENWLQTPQGAVIITKRLLVCVPIETRPCLVWLRARDARRNAYLPV